MWNLCRTLGSMRDHLQGIGECEQHHCALRSQSVGKNVTYIVIFIHHIWKIRCQIYWLSNIFTNLNANPHNPQFIAWLKGKLVMNLAVFQYPHLQIICWDDYTH